MIYSTPKELLSEIKRIMDINDITMKDLSVRMNKSQQSISQIFKISNPTLETLYNMCNCLDIDIDISFNRK